MRRPWGKRGKSMVFQWWYCMSHQYLVPSRTDPPCWNHLQNPITTAFIICLIIWCHCGSDTKIMTRLRHITFRCSSMEARLRSLSLFFPSRVSHVFLLVMVTKAKSIVYRCWACWFGSDILCCVLFFLLFFQFVNISGMHLNHVAVFLSHYEPLW